MKNNIILENARIEDSDNILIWRNDELTRKMSLDTKRIDKKEHEKWFQNSLTNKNITTYIGKLAEESQRIGLVRFIKGEKSTVVSINLNPCMRGKKLSTPLLVKSLKKYNGVNKNDLIAVIRKQNTASIKCFKASGFVKFSEDEYSYSYILKAETI